VHHVTYLQVIYVIHFEEFNPLIATELFKTSMDSASLLVSMKKKRLIWVGVFSWCRHKEGRFLNL